MPRRARAGRCASCRPCGSACAACGRRPAGSAGACRGARPRGPSRRSGRGWPAAGCGTRPGAASRRPARCSSAARPARRCLPRARVQCPRRGSACSECESPDNGDDGASPRAAAGRERSPATARPVRCRCAAPSRRAGHRDGGPRCAARPAGGLRAVGRGRPAASPPAFPATSAPRCCTPGPTAPSTTWSTASSTTSPWPPGSGRPSAGRRWRTSRRWSTTRATPVSRGSRASSRGRRSRDPRWRMTLLTIAAVFAITSLLQLFVMPHLAGWPLEARLLLSATVVVTGMAHVVMPALTRLFARWLHPPADGAHGPPRRRPLSQCGDAGAEMVVPTAYAFSMTTFQLPVRGPFSLGASVRFLEGFTPAAMAARRTASCDSRSRSTAADRSGGSAPGSRRRRVVSVEGPVPERLPGQLARILSLDVDGSGFPAVCAADPVVAGDRAPLPRAEAGLLPLAVRGRLLGRAVPAAEQGRAPRRSRSASRSASGSTARSTASTCGHSRRPGGSTRSPRNCRCRRSSRPGCADWRTPRWTVVSTPTACARYRSGRRVRPCRSWRAWVRSPRTWSWCGAQVPPMSSR